MHPGTKYSGHSGRNGTDLITLVEINALRRVDPENDHLDRYMPYTYLISEDLDKWTQSHNGGRHYRAMTTNILMGYLTVPAVYPLLQWLSSLGANLLHISMIDIKKLLMFSFRLGVE